MWVYSGKITLKKLLGERIFYRDLNPVDPLLPRFSDILRETGLEMSFAPRKTSTHYARIILQFLRRSAPAWPKQIFFFGDTPGNDGAVVQNLSRLSGARVFGFIGRDAQNQPPRLETRPPLFLANRWELIVRFFEELLTEGLDLRAPTAVFFDMDKTLLGARGRNDAQIDAARMDGVRNLIQQTVADRWKEEQFFFIYKTLNQPEYHFLTEDNQDYLAFICLMIMAGVWNFDELLHLLIQQKITSFGDFLNRTGTRILQSADAPVQNYFEEVLSGTAAGDPTPFKSFRYKEYEATLARIDRTDSTDPAILIDQEILLTQELVELITLLKQIPNVAPFFCISDKPPESTFPPPLKKDRAALPLHDVPIKIVGTTVAAKLRRLFSLS